MVVELGLEGLETALSFLGQVGYKNKCALLGVPPAQANGNLETQVFLYGE